MSSLKPYIPAAASIVMTMPGAALGGYITNINLKSWYNRTSLKKPSWRPSNRTFGPIWSVLYPSMGLASYLVWRDGGGFHGTARTALMLYGTQLALNWAWTPVFFGAKYLGWALVNLIALDASILACMWTFHPINPMATLLMAPYLAWSLFATVLNHWIYVQNKDGKHLL